MAGESPGEPLDTRPPTLEDLLLICRHLNAQHARYIVIGGFAIFEHGLARLTDDIDLLVDSSLDNVARVKTALECLPDKASRDVHDSDVSTYAVVRINDEITVDLMATACGIDYARAERMIDWREIQGVRIPVASPALLWLTKQTNREKDALDRAFLRKWFADRGLEPPTSGA
jgi:hypothetical protein